MARASPAEAAEAPGKSVEPSILQNVLTGIDVTDHPCSIVSSDFHNELTRMRVLLVIVSLLVPQGLTSLGCGVLCAMNALDYDCLYPPGLSIGLGVFGLFTATVCWLWYDEIIVLHRPVRIVSDLAFFLASTLLILNTLSTYFKDQPPRIEDVATTTGLLYLLPVLGATMEVYRLNVVLCSVINVIPVIVSSHTGAVYSLKLAVTYVGISGLVVVILQGNRRRHDDSISLRQEQQQGSSERDAAEEACAKARSLAKVLSSTGDDLRIPVAAVLSGCRVLKAWCDRASIADNGNNGSTADAVLVQMDAACQMSLRFLDGMSLSATFLDDTRTLAVNLGYVNVIHMIERAVASAQPFCSASDKAHINVSYMVDPGLRDGIFSDGVCLSRSMVALVINAYQRISQGHIRIDVVLSAALPNDRDHAVISVKFSVTDTGAHVSQRDCEHIWEPFATRDGSSGVLE